MPETLGAWIRLEIPASYVGLEGKVVKGMAFGVYKKDGKGRAVWDYSGKTSSAPTTTIAALRFTNPLWRYNCGAGSEYRTEYKMLLDYDFFGGGCNPGDDSGGIYDYPAPGTIPLHAYKSGDNKWFLTVCTLPSCVGTGWTHQYILGHVIHPSDTTTTDAVPHQLWSCNSNYYYTTSTANPGGCTYVGNAGYKVHTH